MEIASLGEWLRCPHCALDLEPSPPLALRCGNGHSFDANRRGFVNLVPSTDRMTGDSAEMLDARAAFLAAGHFTPISNALGRALPAGARRIVDAGCGTGDYLQAVLRASADATARALAFDLSPEAVRRAVRRTGASGLVADTWRPLPIRDGSADVILNVFAPRNLPEFHRVLARAGSLLVVVPSAEHLRELRATGRAIDIPEAKAERLSVEAAPLFEAVTVERIEFPMQLDERAIAHLIGMGPSSHHRSGRSESDGDAAAHESVTASVDLLTLRRND